MGKTRVVNLDSRDVKIKKYIRNGVRSKVKLICIIDRGHDLTFA